MKAWIGRVPIDGHRHAQRVIRGIVSHGADDDGIDTKHAGNRLVVGGAIEFNPVGPQDLFNDTSWHHLKSTNLLKFVVESQRDTVLIQSRIGRLIEKRQYCDAVQLRKRIVELRLIRDLGDGSTASREQ